MAIIGLTGGIGSGKSAAARHFAALGIPVIDTDVIAHTLTKAGSAILDAIVAQFGDTILDAQGELNRAALRTIVFNNMQARQALEAIMHPAIQGQVALSLVENKQLNAPYQVIVVPLLFETQHYKNIISRSLVIDCDEEIQVARTLARHKQKMATMPIAAQNELSQADVRAVMAAQLSRTARIKMADDIIENNGSETDLYEDVLKMHEKYCDLCKKPA